MFIVLLKFSNNKSQAGQFMAAHNDWLSRGFDQGAFLLTGSLQPGLGGVILAKAESPDMLLSRLQDDPFVREDVVTAEILEFSPNQANESLSCLMG